MFFSAVRITEDKFLIVFCSFRRDQSKIIFKAESEDEKNSWMAALVMLNTKFVLERLLDVVLFNEEKKHPLKFPPSDRYVFTEPDSDENIIFEKNEKSNVPLIKVRQKLFCGTFETDFDNFVILAGRNAGETGRETDVPRLRRPNVHEDLPDDLPELLQPSRALGPAHCSKET